jgi:hypothetical protein
MNERFIERPDLIKFENDLDFMVVRPSSWELYIKEKDTGEEFTDEFPSKDEARNVLLKEIADSNKENQDEDDDNNENDNEDNNNDYGDDDYDSEYGDIQ